MCQKVTNSVYYMYSSLRGRLKKIDKIAFSLVLGVISLTGRGKSGDFEQNLLWLGLNSQF